VDTTFPWVHAKDAYAKPPSDDLLLSSFSCPSNVEPSLSLADIPNFIMETARLYCLEYEQVIAFCISAAKSLRGYDPEFPLSDLPLEFPEGFFNDPLRFLVTGEGGTGKSRVISAERFVHACIDRQLWISAYVGVAAANAGGLTSNSTYSLSSSRGDKKETPSEDLRFTPAKRPKIAFDEISTLGASLFSRIDENTQIFCRMRRRAIWRSIAVPTFR
jgi:hypothetical protein